jgi:hypothetical protein
MGDNVFFKDKICSTVLHWYSIGLQCKRSWDQFWWVTMYFSQIKYALLLQSYVLLVFHCRIKENSVIHTANYIYCLIEGRSSFFIYILRHRMEESNGIVFRKLSTNQNTLSNILIGQIMSVSIKLIFESVIYCKTWYR